VTIIWKIAARVGRREEPELLECTFYAGPLMTIEELRAGQRFREQELIADQGEAQGLPRYEEPEFLSWQPKPPSRKDES
jgi:hypothetical protein